MVVPTRLCSHISKMATAKSRSGFEYEVENGDGLLNMAERRCFMMTEISGTMKCIAFQCADVHKPLLIVMFRPLDLLPPQLEIGASTGSIRFTWKMVDMINSGRDLSEA